MSLSAIPNGGLPSRNSGNSLSDARRSRLGPLSCGRARHARSIAQRRSTTTLLRTIPFPSSNIPRHPIHQLYCLLLIPLRPSTPTSPLPRATPQLRTTAPCSPRHRHLHLRHCTRTTRQLRRAILSHTYVPHHRLITTAPSYLYWIRYKNT